MQLRVLLDGLCFPEGPRWRDGRLWFSDMHAHEVVTVDPEGSRETVVTVPHQPSGLGWTPDGRLLVVSMHDRRVLRLDPGGLTEHADLSGLATWHCNDMLVDAAGGAYVGNFGSDYGPGRPADPAVLIRVEPDGRVRAVAADLRFPNGMALTPDGSMLIVAESQGNRLTAFDRGPDGALANRRVWAELGGVFPDGICLDEQGGVWVADARGDAVLLVREGGEVTARVPVADRHAYACVLGGPDRRTLFVCTAQRSGPGTIEDRAGRIETVTVDVPGAGIP